MYLCWCTEVLNTWAVTMLTGDKWSHQGHDRITTKKDSICE